ncbi:carbohydrate-binding module family 13 protein [Rhizophagus clarus]|uniref:Carbohydrate-binding module family 13 protein n=1 Tax=Rhizophagus clarus TaxID=94130 RepID=A0A8H3KXX4_9GLOM|nr:carbohydrate-binding module family 13 protein [Rhizophagus clarus]
MDNNKFLLPKLSQNLLEILNDDEYYDITIEKNDGTLTHIKLSNISPEIFQIILRYIYGGKLSLNEYDDSDIIKILVAANELSLQELVIYLQYFLIERKTSWIEKNFNLVYQTSYENDSLLELQKYCTNLISKEPDKILKSPEFSSISENLLVSIIQNEKLQMKEIQIWEHVLKWGLAQNPELPSEITNFSKDDFNTLKNSLQQCLPFINFYNLTSKEFVDKVFPYREILPEELCADLLKSFLTLSNPDSKPIDRSKPHKTKKFKLKTVDSKIITPQHAELILGWGNKFEMTDELASSYKFKLLFRASHNGHSHDIFHQICNNQSHTVTIVKVKDSNEILGGYNPIEWKSDNKYGTTEDSFIFSFNNDKIENYTLSRVMKENNAIKNNSYFGPSFGVKDLTIWGISGSYCKKFSYEKSIRKSESNFTIEECEVFQIVHS